MFSGVIVVVIGLVVDHQPGLVVHVLLSLGHLLNEWSHDASILLVQLSNDHLQLLVHCNYLALVGVGEGVNVGDSHQAVEEVDVREEVLVERAGVVDGRHYILSVEFSLDLSLRLLCLLVVEDARLEENLHERFLGQLGEVLKLIDTSVGEHGGKEGGVLVEDLAVVVRVELADESVLHHPLLEFDVAVVEHLFEHVLVGALDLGLPVLLHLVIRSSDDSLEEHGVVEAVLDAETVLQGQADQLVQGFKYAEGLVVGACELHDLEEVDEALDRDHLVLLLAEHLRLQGAVELEVVAQVQVEDRQY